MIFVLLLCSAFSKIQSTIKIGADEDYEFSKIVLYQRGFNFYTDVWNDQPLLHTAAVAALRKQFGNSSTAPRLFTTCFAITLASSLYILAWKLFGKVIAQIAVLLLFFSPGFVDLASSCMVEIPALATSLAACSVIAVAPLKFRGNVMVAGLLLGIALEIKLISIVLLPIAVLVIVVRTIEEAKDAHARPFTLSKLFVDCAIACAVLAFTFLIISVLLPGGSFLLEMKQSWSAHFANARSFEYGSPSDFPFDWSVLAKNWDQTVPALVGMALCLRRVRENRWFVIPIVWCFTELLVFGLHTPWWSYYYVHNAVPIALLAAMGFVWIGRQVLERRQLIARAAFTTFCIAAAGWMVTRVYLQINTIRNSPQTYNSLVLAEIKRFKPFTEFMFAEEGVYSFHADIPLPPHLAVLSLKRFWSGDMTNEKVRQEMWNVQPGLVMVGNDGKERPFRDLLQQRYSMVYEDQKHRLFARKDIVKLAKW